MSTKIQSIKFHQDTLTAIFYNDKPFVAMKPICESIGLDWHAQRQRINRDEVLSEGKVVITSPSSGGHQETLFLPIEMLQGWMFGVSIKRVKPELREKLIQYKRECYQVLHDYFTKGEAVNPRHTPPVKRQPPKFRYLINMTVQDFVTGQTETFKGGANTPQEIVNGTARRYGIHIFDMMPTPITAF